LNNPQHPPKRNSYLIVFAWISAILFVISSVGVIFAFFPTRKLLNPNFYKSALENVGFYERLPESIAQQLAVNLTQRGSDTSSPVVLLLLNQQEWETILTGLINPSWLQTQTENILDQFFDILLVSPDPLNTPINVSILEIKNSLAGGEGVLAFNQILNAQQDCSLDQVMGLLQLGLGMQPQIDTLLCRPPDYIITELNPIVQSLLSAAVTQVPDEVSFTLLTAMQLSSSAGSPQELSPGELPEFISSLRRTNTMISRSPLLPITFLLLLSIFAVRSLRDMLRWWGSVFLTAGGISLIILLILYLTMDWSLGRLVPIPISVYGLPPLLVQMGLVEFSQELVTNLALSMVIPAGTLTVLGILLLLGTYLLPKDKQSSIPQQEEIMY
jgi:hypothetical protein